MGQRRGTVGIFLPRLDLPWGTQHRDKPVPILDDAVLDLRLHWKAFTIRLANALEVSGVPVRLIEIPNSQITPERVDLEESALALLPHRCHLNFSPGTTPVLYYMQEYFRWCFVVDEMGWSAASSRYPLRHDSTRTNRPDRFAYYQGELRGGQLSSKFRQADSAASHAGAHNAELPADPFIFFPLQIPYDQSIAYFSDVAEQDVVEALANWSRRTGVPLVLKPHPANLKSTLPFKRHVDGKTVFWSEAHVYDLISAARAVYTINSGVGFESLLQAKPIVTFGRVDYDGVTFKGTITDLDAAWRHCLGSDANELEVAYSDFFNWFMNAYVFDMTNRGHVEQQLLDLASAIKARIAPIVD